MMHRAFDKNHVNHGYDAVSLCLIVQSQIISLARAIHKSVSLCSVCMFDRLNRSGFVTAITALSQNEVDYVLITVARTKVKRGFQTWPNFGQSRGRRWSRRDKF